MTQCGIGRRSALVFALAFGGATLAPGLGMAQTEHLFAPIARVLQHPRCSNCHPGTDTPLQGDQRRPHVMSITRGADNHGAPAAHCQSCHRDQNSKISFVPGAPHWRLAPANNTWHGKPLKQACEDLKDRTINRGPENPEGLSLEGLLHHVETDKLIRWALVPDHGRTLPMGFDEFRARFKAWVDAGGPCPD